jgi:hypothetical protein
MFEEFFSPESDYQTYDTPTYDTPTYDTPTYDTPTYDTPTYDTPTYDAPAYSEVGYSTELPATEYADYGPLDAAYAESLRRPELSFEPYRSEAYAPYTSQENPAQTFRPSIDSQEAYANGSAYSGAPPGPLAAIGEALGMSDKSGGVNLKDPRVLDQWLKAGLGGAQLLNAIFGSRKRGYADPKELQRAVQGPANTFTPTQQQWASGYFGSPVNVNRARLQARDMPNSIAPSRAYADGGTVAPGNIFARRAAALAAAENAATSTGEDANAAYQRVMFPRTAASAARGVEPETGALQRIVEVLRSRPRGYAAGGEIEPQLPAGYVEGSAGGQDDVVDIRAAPGEYVFDAESVSALGDGNNERGADILDEVRRRIRAQKRAAPDDEIPPRALPFGAYLKGADDGA